MTELEKRQQELLQVIEFSDGCTLKDIGVELEEPHERKDRGAIPYIHTVAEAVDSWQQDPTGDHVYRFMTEAYGIPEDKTEEVLKEAGMDDYLQWKKDGRFVGMVASQVLIPTHYFMTNARALGELHSRGVPTAFLVLDYAGDTFFAGNGDKRGAFEKIKFIVDAHREEDEITYDYVELQLQPYAVREKDGSIRRVHTIDDINGYPCDDIYVRTVHASGPGSNSAGQFWSKHDLGKVPLNQGEPPKKVRAVQVYPYAALGFEPNNLQSRRVEPHAFDIMMEPTGQLVSMTDFYRQMWETTVAHMRAVGDLPAEEDMPMTIVDVGQLYRTIATHAAPPAATLDTLGFTRPASELLTDMFMHTDEDIAEFKRLMTESEAFHEDISDEEVLSEVMRIAGLHFAPNGLLMNDKGMMDPASYYAFQKLWPDLYLECSSCGGDYFVQKIKKAGTLTKKHGIPIKQIRLPDTEIPELEEYAIHPGRLLDLQKIDDYHNDLIAHLHTLAKEKKGKERDDIYKALRARSDTKHQTMARVMQEPDRYPGLFKPTPLVVPRRVQAFMNTIFEDFPDKI